LQSYYLLGQILLHGAVNRKQSDQTDSETVLARAYLYEKITPPHFRPKRRTDFAAEKRGELQA